jgi:hypothetical protein
MSSRSTEGFYMSTKYLQSVSDLILDNTDTSVALPAVLSHSVMLYYINQAWQLAKSSLSLCQRASFCLGNVDCFHHAMLVATETIIIPDTELEVESSIRVRVLKETSFPWFYSLPLEVESNQRPSDL